MLIDVQCPHCESHFRLQADLLGRYLRCPVCREVYKVAESAPKPETVANNPDDSAPASGRAGSRADAPEASYRSGAVGDLVPVLSAEFMPADNPPAPSVEFLPASMPDPAPEPVTLDPVAPQPDGPAVPYTVQPDVAQPLALPLEREPDPPAPREVVWGQSTESAPARRPAPPAKSDEDPTGPMEVAWSPEVAPPGERAADEPVAAPTPAALPAHARRRRRRRKIQIAALLLFIVGVVGVGGAFLKQHFDKSPERIFAKARKEYDENHPGPAGKLFDELVREYPDSPHRDEARFFAALCALKSSVYSATNVSNPAPALEQWKRFRATINDAALAPFAARGRFAPDVWQTLQKLVEDTTVRAGQDFDQDKPNATEGWLNRVEEVVPDLERYRPEGVGRESVLGDITTWRARLAAAHTRLADLAEIQALLTPDVLSDERIHQANERGREKRLDNDGRFREIVRDAEQRLQALAGYRRYDPPVPPKPAWDDGLSGLLFAPRLDHGGPAPPAAGRDAETVFFALARGVLYALDEGSGRVLWASRVGVDCDTLPLPVPPVRPQVALVAVNDGVRPSLTARDAHTGEALWSQPLDAPCAGRPVLVGQRAYVPLRDRPAGAGGKKPESGVVLEVEIASGHLLGRIVLGRPLGTGAVRRPGTGLVYFPAETGSVYVFDVDRQAPDGARLDPVKVGVLETGHPAGTLLGEPVLANAEPGEPGPAYLILGQADGLDAMKVRAFALPGPNAPVPAGTVPQEVRLSGWSAFGPHCDGEKVAVVTDRGEFGLFGVNQAGNRDGPLFLVPPEPYRLPASGASRGQVVAAEEGSFWVLGLGALRHLRLGFDARDGLKLVPDGKPLQLGEPLQPPQVNPRRDTAVVVTQAVGSASCVATAIDLHGGQVRWQRQLGMLPQGDPVRIGTVVVLTDQNAGLYAIDPARVDAASNVEWRIDEQGLLAEPLPEVVGTPVLVRSPDGNAVVAVAAVPPARDEGNRLVVRRFTPGRPVEETVVPLPALPAGTPAFTGTALLVPLQDGSLYRLVPGESATLEEGPTWRGERLPANTVCYLTAVNAEEFLATDGGKVLTRWRWPKGQLFEPRLRATLPDRVVSTPAVFRVEGGLRVAVADAKGTVTLWDADRLKEPLRRWVSGGKDGPPAGPVTAGPVVTQAAEGGVRIGYVVAGTRVVWLSPDDDRPAWVSPKPARPGALLLGVPQRDNGRVLLTDRSGEFRLLTDDRGAPAGAPVTLPSGATPACAAVPFGNRRLLAPLTDGTIVLLTLPEK